MCFSLFVFLYEKASSTGTRSRSATPDSLDSVSPPHTPPEDTTPSWVAPYLSHSRGSLDSGNHSLVTSTPAHSFPSEDVYSESSDPNRPNRRNSPISELRSRFVIALV